MSSPRVNGSVMAGLVVPIQAILEGNAAINVNPHRGNFPCLEWQTCPRGQDIESVMCACAIRIVRVRGVHSAVPCHYALPHYAGIIMR